MYIYIYVDVNVDVNRYFGCSKVNGETTTCCACPRPPPDTPCVWARRSSGIGRRRSDQSCQAQLMPRTCSCSPDAGLLSSFTADTVALKAAGSPFQDYIYSLYSQEGKTAY